MGKSVRAGFVWLSCRAANGASSCAGGGGGGQQVLWIVAQCSSFCPAAAEEQGASALLPFTNFATISSGDCWPCPTAGIPRAEVVLII